MDGTLRCHCCRSPLDEYNALKVYTGTLCRECFAKSREVLRNRNYFGQDSETLSEAHSILKQYGLYDTFNKALNMIIDLYPTLPVIDMHIINNEHSALCLKLFCAIEGREGRVVIDLRIDDWKPYLEVSHGYLSRGDRDVNGRVDIWTKDGLKDTGYWKKFRRSEFEWSDCTWINELKINPGVVKSSAWDKIVPDFDWV